MKTYKLGMTLIEILMVVWILGILLWICIPKFSWSQGKSRDILRKSQINEIWSAIVSYWIDHGWYPISSGTCISSLTGLVEEWYLTKIDPDPNNETITTYCGWDNNTQYNICSGSYYNYISNGERFVLAAYMESEWNWNYMCINSDNCLNNDTDKEHLCQDLAELWSGWDLSNFLSSNKLNNWLKYSHIYVYLHQ